MALIIYKKTTGEPMEMQKLDLFPEGFPDADPFINSVISAFGGTVEDYDVFRLHDIEDAEIVDKTFTHEYTIQNGEVVFGDVKPTPEPPTPEPSPVDLLGQQLVEKEIQILELQSDAEFLAMQSIEKDFLIFDLQEENAVLGKQLVDIDLRLMMGGM